MVRSFYSILGSSFLMTILGCRMIPRISSTPTEPLAETEMETPAASPVVVREEDDEDPEILKKRIDDLELKQAQMTVRIDELDDIIQDQKAYLAVLEKGLLTGLPPEELGKWRKKRGSNKPSSPPLEGKKSQPSVKAENHSQNDSEPPKKFVKLDLVDIADLYGKGEFSLMVRRLEEMKLSSQDDLEGSKKIHWWLGRGYFSLKDYEKAKDEFLLLVDENLDFVDQPRVKFELGKTYLALHQPERASQVFKSILQENPDHEASQMAHLELEKIKKNL